MTASCPTGARPASPTEAAFLRSRSPPPQAFDAASLTREQRFERDYLIARARGDLFWIDDAPTSRTPTRLIISARLDPSVYVTRPYAPPRARLRAYIAYLRGMSRARREQIRANLRTPLPLSFIDYGKAGFGGFAEYYPRRRQGRLRRGPRRRAAGRARAPPATPPRAMKGLADWLEASAPRADPDFALGRGQVRADAARHRDGRHAARPSSRRSAAPTSSATRTLLRAACAPLCAGRDDPGLHGPDERQQARGRPGRRRAARSSPGSSASSIEQDLVTIPGTEEAQVEEAPPYNRQNFAYIDIPGPVREGPAVGLLYRAARPELDAGGAGRLRPRRGRPAVHLGARGVAGPLPQLPPRQPLALPLRPGVRRLRLRRGLGALYRGDDVGSPGSATATDEIHDRPALQRPAARLPLPVGDRHAHRADDAGAVAPDVPRAMLPGRGQCPPAGGARHLRSGLSQLHDGQADDPPAARRLDRDARRPQRLEGLPRPVPELRRPADPAGARSR